MLQQVSDFELELMKIIWENGGTALYAEIVEKLDSKGMSTTKNTIISLLLRLIEKGFLKTNKIGRRNRYTALVSEAEYQASQTETFLDKIYEGDAKGLISTLIQKELISADDYEELITGEAVIIKNERAAKNNPFPVSLRVIFDSYFTALQAHCPRPVKQTMAVLYLAGRHFPSAASLYSGSQSCGKSVSAYRYCGSFVGCRLICGTK